MTGFNYSQNAPRIFSQQFVFKDNKTKIIIIIASKDTGWETSLLQEISQHIKEPALPN